MELLREYDENENEHSEFEESVRIHNMLNEDDEIIAQKPKKDIRLLDKSKSDLLLKTVENLKHKTAILLMMDCGLRVTECVTIKMKDFDFRKRVVMVKTLKKRGEIVIRKIPMSNRLIETMAQHLKTCVTKTEDDYLFDKPNCPGEHLNRRAMNKMCDRLKKRNPAFSQLHPHALRHTFATRLLATGTSLHDVSIMLGHTSYNTTLIYNHTPLELLRQNIDNATKEKLSWIQKIKRLIVPKRPASIINLSTNPQNFLIGREKEIGQVVNNLNKNINTILIGKIGMGKTHLLKQIEFPNRKILKVDELTNLKMTLVNILLYLYNNDKEHIKEMLFADFDKTQMMSRMQRDSTARLLEEILNITEKHEYILMIDTVDGITGKGMKVIEQLKDHFVIITTAREVPINKANFLWNFERIEIEALTRTQSLELIHRLSSDMDIEDMEVYRNHIYDQSAGNPRIIYELCDRYRKELVITDDVIRSVKHIGGIPEIDMTFLIVFILAGVAVLRYTSREVGGTNYRFIGGIALVLLMMSRFFLSKMKRKFI